MSCIWRGVVPLLLWAGCSGGTVSDTDNIIAPLPDPEPPVIPTADTEGEGFAIDASLFAVLGRFGYDEEAEQFTTYAHPDVGLLPISISVLLIDSEVLSTGIIDATNSCEISLEHDGALQNAPWVEKNTAWAGFDLPTTATVRDGCRPYGLPATFEGDAGKHVSKWSWAVGVGPLDPDTEDQLESSLPASEWAALQPFAVGGVLLSNHFAGSSLSEDGYLDIGVGLGFEVDGNFQIELGGTGNPEPISSAFINAPGGIATGYYEVDVGLFEPASFLAENVP